jgi:hypothetical protein
MNGNENQELNLRHAARYPFVWTNTTEEERFIRENRRNVGEDVPFYAWDIIMGWQRLSKSGNIWLWQDVDIESPSSQPPQMPGGNAMKMHNPHEALAQIWDGKVSHFDGEGIFFLKDFHKFFKDATVCRRALTIKEHLKGHGKTVCFIAPMTDLPPEIKNDVSVIDFDMPSPDSLEKILECVAEDNEVDIIKDDRDPLIEAMMGFTSEAAENALAYSLAAHGEFNIKTVLDMKAAYLSAGGMLTYGRFTETLDDLYGLEYLKHFVLSTIHKSKSRGVLIYGVPGVGKSHFAKAIANAVQRACLIANFAAIRSRYQGEAEQRIMDLLKTVDAFGRPIVFGDEFDKVISGTGSADTDSGVGQRILGEFLKYTEDRGPNSAYWILTLNDIQDVLHLSGGALLRRFDALFFVDMPNKEEAKGIREIWNRKEEVEIPENWSFDGYTGADIAKLATHMSMMECSAEEAEHFIIPYGRANKGELENIRSNAKGTCIWASRKDDITAPTKRKVAKKKNSVASHLH